MAEPRSSDLGAALTGLVVGAVVLFAIMFAIVKITNASYASHEPAAATAEQQPPAPAPAAPNQ